MAPPIGSSSPYFSSLQPSPNKESPISTTMNNEAQQFASTLTSSQNNNDDQKKKSVRKLTPTKPFIPSLAIWEKIKAPLKKSALETTPETPRGKNKEKNCSRFSNLIEIKKAIELSVNSTSSAQELFREDTKETKYINDYMNGACAEWREGIIHTSEIQNFIKDAVNELTKEEQPDRLVQSQAEQLMQLLFNNLKNSIDPESSAPPLSEQCKITLTHMKITSQARFPKEDIETILFAHLFARHLIPYLLPKESLTPRGRSQLYLQKALLRLITNLKQCPSFMSSVLNYTQPVEELAFRARARTFD